MSNHRELLIDGDIVAYRFSVDVTSQYDWGDGTESTTADIGLAEQRVNKWLEHMTNRLQAGSYVIALSDPSRRYFRHDLWSDYKAHRTHGAAPAILPEVKQMLRDKFDAKIKPNLEADDVLGILSTWPDHCPGCEKIIVSLDKDMATIPGLHFDYNKDKAVRSVSEAQANYNHLMQTLSGDTCDGFKGCPGIGPKRAAKILALDNFTGNPQQVQYSRWIAVVEGFEKRGLTAEDALRNARMARILRAEDWNFTTQKAIPWNPPQY